MKFENLRILLESTDQDKVLKALMILKKNPKIEFEDEIVKIVDKFGPSLIKSVAEQVLKKISKLKDSVEETDEKLQGVFSEFPTLKTDEKIQLLKNILSGQTVLESGFGSFYMLFLDENTPEVIYLMAKIAAVKFPSKAQAKLDTLKEFPLHRTKALALMIFLDKPEFLEPILDEFLKSDNEFFLSAATDYVWKHSRIVFISKVKDLADSSATPVRILAGKLCARINSPLLKGIVEHLLDSPNETIKALAHQVHIEIENTTIADPYNFEVLPHQGNVDYSEILDREHDLQGKLAAIKCLDEAGNPNFVDILSKKLTNLKNPFLVSACLKYIGKFGNSDYNELLFPYLKHKDPRVVANCIEGLAYNSIEMIQNILQKFIVENKHHRIASAAALALWKNGNEKDSLSYLNSALESKKLWERKAGLNMIEQGGESLIAQSESLITILLQDPSDDIRRRATALLQSAAENDYSESMEVDIGNLVTEIDEAEGSESKGFSDILLESMNILTSPSKGSKMKKKAIAMIKSVAKGDDVEALKGLFDSENLSTPIKIDLLDIIIQIDNEPLPFVISLFNHPEPKLRYTSLCILQNYNCSGWQENIVPLLYDDSSEVIGKASELLFQYTPEKVMDALRKLSYSESGHDHLVLLNSISKIGSVRFYSLVTGLLKSESTEIVILASKVLAELHDRHADLLSNIENPSNKTEVSEQDAQNNLLDLVNSLSEITDPAVIEKKMDPVLQMISKENLLLLLSFMETCSNVVLISKLCTILGRFSEQDEIRKIIAKFMNHPDERISANTVESMVFSSEVILVDTICQLIRRDSQRIKMAVMKLMFLNSEFGNAISEILSAEEYENFMKEMTPNHFRLKFLNPVLEREIKKVRKDATKDTKKKVPAPSPPKKEPEPEKTPDRPNNEGPNFKPMVYGLTGLCAFEFFVILSLIISSYFTKPTVIEKIVTIEKPVPVVQTPVKTVPSVIPEPVEKIDFKFPPLPYTLSKAKEIWNSISEIRNISKKGRFKLYAKLVLTMEKDYFRGEFYSTKKFLKKGAFFEAETQFIEALQHIDRDEILWDWKKGIWKTREAAEELILQNLQPK